MCYKWYNSCSTWLLDVRMYLQGLDTLLQVGTGNDHTENMTQWESCCRLTECIKEQPTKQIKARMLVSQEDISSCTELTECVKE